MPARLCTVPVTTLLYCVCASKALYSSCHHTALLCVCQQGSLKFLSPYYITVCVPARLSAVPVTILHYSVWASKALYSSCHHTAFRVCVPARLSAFPVTILHYSMCASKAPYSSYHHTALQCVCQQGSLQFLSPYCITVCVPAKLSAVCCCVNGD